MTEPKSKKKAKARLSDLKTYEVSLVDNGANLKTFLMLKNEEGDAMSESLMKKIMSTDLKNETEIDEVLKSEDISDDQRKTVKAALRLLSSVSDDVREEALKKALDLTDTETTGDPTPDRKAKGEDGNQGNPKIKGEAMDEIKKDETKEAPAPEDKPSEQPSEKPEEKPEDKPEEKAEASGTAETPEVGEPVTKDGKLNESAIPEQVRPFVTELWKKQQVTEAELRKERDERKKAEFVEVAKGFNNLGVEAEKFGPVLKAIAESAPKAYEEMLKVLKSADAGLAKLFDEAGSDAAAGGSTDSWAKIEGMAKELVQKSEGKLSQADAISQVLSTDNGRKLYDQYNAEMGGAA